MKILFFEPIFFSKQAWQDSNEAVMSESKEVLQTVSEAPKPRRLFRIFYYVLLAYAFPFIAFFLLLLDAYTLQSTGIFPLAVLLFFLVPCSLLGLLLNVIGLISAYRRANARNRLIGWIGVGFGVAGLAAGLFAWMMIYVFTS